VAPLRRSHCSHVCLLIEFVRNAVAHPHEQSGTDSMFTLGDSRWPAQSSLITTR
jgi:hypothetical protein